MCICVCSAVYVWFPGPVCMETGRGHQASCSVTLYFSPLSWGCATQPEARLSLNLKAPAILLPPPTRALKCVCSHVCLVRGCWDLNAGLMLAQNVFLPTECLPSPLLSF